MKLLATVTKGLEDISVSEIEEIGGINLEVSQKYIYFDIEDIKKCADLRTVDDVFLKVKKTTYYENFAKDLEEVLAEGLVSIKELRDKSQKISITISIYKNSKVDKQGLEESIKALAESGLSLKLSREDESDYNLRVIIEENNLFVGLRLFKRALKDRDYADRKNYMGSLRPTIAAAMIRMVSGDLKGLEIVDNFCGSGTFLAESSLFGHNPHGGDISESAVKVASSTLLNYFHIKKPDVFAQDAKETKWDDDSFDIAVSNYPWDSQIKVDSFTELYELSIREYARILKPQSALSFILTKPELMVKFIKQYFPEHKVVTRQIGYLGQTPWIIIASNL